MDELTSTIEKLTTDLASDSWDFRKSQFKFNDKTSESSRDKRRIQLIEDLKRKRDILLNEKRGLLDCKFDENEDWMDWQDLGKRSPRRQWVNKLCKNQLMLSEWLLDRPVEIETKWVCVVCPTGRRALVIAKRGCTRAYHKNGMLLAKFKSILPNGGWTNKVHSKGGVIILDCIWQETTKRLYALDVLHWNNHPLLNCDANFRLYWLSSKLKELQRCEDERSKDIYDVFIPPHCSLSALSQALGEVEPEQVDGVLFFHGQAPYISGQTPLVGWLKPYMVPERLGVQVPPPYLVLRPPEYESLEKWVEAVSHCHRRKPGRRTKAKHEKMEDLDASDTSSTVSEMEAAEI